MALADLTAQPSTFNKRYPSAAQGLRVGGTAGLSCCTDCGTTTISAAPFIPSSCITLSNTQLNNWRMAAEAALITEGSFEKFRWIANAIHLNNQSLLFNSPSLPLPKTHLWPKPQKSQMESMFGELGVPHTRFRLNSAIRSLSVPLSPQILPLFIPKNT